MKKTIIILLTALLALSVFVACDQDTILDDMFDGGSEPADTKMTITFDANSGSGTMPPVKMDAGNYLLPDNDFTAPDGYAFVRWSDTPEGTEEYEVGDTYEVTEDLTLYAIWATVLSETPSQYLTGRYTVSADSTTITDTRIEADGILKLYLPDGKTLNVNKGIKVSSIDTLIIDKVGTSGSGTLLIDGVGDNYAGIGGNDETCGTVVINGGTVDVTGGSSGAGIGGGCGGDGGTISISGGDVEATGGLYGAGIGGGNGGYGGTISISGGDVEATGGSCGAGIGGGYNRSGGTIDINGGTVTATGGSANESFRAGAGIGGGANGTGGIVTINGGKVTATGGPGSGTYSPGTGIGAGGIYSHGTLTIGENPTTPYTDGKLRIASGWTLCYGESSASGSIGEGIYDPWSAYAEKCMNVTQPST